MITLRNLSVGHGKQKVIENISLTAENGDITVILGKNGIGKSTLLHAMAGLLPYGGSIQIDGAEVAKTAAKERAAALAMMPQILPTPDISVWELVSFGRACYTPITGVLSTLDRDVIRQVLEQTGLLPLAHKKITAISGGERQKAFFAMVLAQQTDNILLDEPAAFLDSAYTKRLCAFLQDAKQDNKCVVAVLHDINRALQIADKLVVLSDGDVFIGTPAAFLQQNIAQTQFGLTRFEGMNEKGERGIFFQ